VTDKRRWISLYVLCMGMLMIVLDATVVNVALPAIQRDLVSRKGMFLTGLAVFTLASLLCGLAQSQVLLVGARFVQGAGGAMTSAVILGMIVTMFPEPREQAKAIGVFAFVASAGGAIGLLVGGVLTQSISWHWIFFVNVPVGIATAVLAGRLIEADKGIGFRDGADVPGAVLITASLMLGVYTIVNPAAEYGWGAGRTLVLGALSLTLLMAFVAREATAKSPLIPLRIFRSRNVAGANIVQVLSVAGMFGMFFLGALYLQRILGYDALQTGLAFMPVTILMGTLSVRYTDRLVMRFGARKLVLSGLALFMSGLGLFTRAPIGGDYIIDILPVMVLLGVGAGLCFPALMTLAMSGATPDDAGLASGLINTTAQVGGALGLAVLATLSASRSGALIGSGEPTAAALTSGYHLAFGIGAGLVLVAIAVAVTVLRSECRIEEEIQAEPADCEAA
jgi:EmrB/QacA subfamily drug resistance transporter